MVLGLLIVAAVVVAGLYIFVPQVHTALLHAWTVARDDLEKIKADGETLVKRLEAHATKQTAAAAVHTEAAAVSTAAASVATETANIASASASAIKSAVSGVRV